MNKQIPVVGKAISVKDLFGNLRAKMEAEQKKVAAMTEVEYNAYVEAQAAKNAETEQILAQLRGPGFREIK